MGYANTFVRVEIANQRLLCSCGRCYIRQKRDIHNLPSNCTGLEKKISGKGTELQHRPVIERPPPVGHSEPNLEDQRFLGDLQSQHAGRQLQQYARDGQIDGKTFKRAITSMTVRGLGNLRRDGQKRRATQKLEHGVAASAALAKFRFARSRMRASNRLILQELFAQSGGVVRLDFFDSLGGDLPELSQCRKEQQSHPEVEFCHDDKTCYPYYFHPCLNTVSSSNRQAMKSWRWSSDCSKLEQQLSRNPYARLLASDTRACAITGMRLPSSMLTKLKAQMNTFTGQPWVVPDGFEPDKTEAAFVDKREGNHRGPFSLKKVKGTGDNIVEHDQEFILNPEHADGERNNNELNCDVSTSNKILATGLEKRETKSMQIKPETGTEPLAVQITPSSLYVTQHELALSWLAENPNLRSRWLSQRWRQKLGREAHGLVVRHNMSAYCRSLLLHRLVRQLAYLRHEYGAELVKHLSLQAVTQGQVKTLVQIRSNPKEQVSDSPRIAAMLSFAESDDPQEIEQLFVTGEDYDELPSVPFYKMRKLLTKDLFDWLRSEGNEITEHRSYQNIYKKDFVAICHDRRTTNVINMLWKVNNFGSLETNLLPLRAISSSKAAKAN